MAQQHKIIAVDTNVLVAIAKTKKDAIEEAQKEFGKSTEFVVPEAVVREISALENRGKTMKKACAIAKKIISLHGVKTKKTRAKNADSALLELAGQGATVMTNDRELKRRVKKALGGIIELSEGRVKN